MLFGSEEDLGFGMGIVILSSVNEDLDLYH